VDRRADEHQERLTPQTRRSPRSHRTGASSFRASTGSGERMAPRRSFQRRSTPRRCRSRTGRKAPPGRSHLQFGFRRCAGTGERGKVGLVANDPTGISPADNRPRRFRVSAWLGGNGFGILTVNPGELTFEPGLITRSTLRVSGRLVHRRAKVLVVESPLNVEGRAIVLRTDDPSEMLVSRLARTGRFEFVNVWTGPWQHARLFDAIRAAGFRIEHRTRRFLPLWQSVD